MTKTKFGKANSADQRQIPISTHSMACKRSFQVAFFVCVEFIVPLENVSLIWRRFSSCFVLVLISMFRITILYFNEYILCFVFQNRSYENHISGDFILYRNNLFNQEV